MAYYMSSNIFDSLHRLVHPSFLICPDSQSSRWNWESDLGNLTPDPKLLITKLYSFSL